MPAKFGILCYLIPVVERLHKTTLTLQHWEHSAISRSSEQNLNYIRQVGLPVYWPGISRVKSLLPLDFLFVHFVERT